MMRDQLGQACDHRAPSIRGTLWRIARETGYDVAILGLCHLRTDLLPRPWPCAAMSTEDFSSRPSASVGSQRAPIMCPRLVSQLR